MYLHLSLRNKRKFHHFVPVIKNDELSKSVDVFTDSILHFYQNLWRKINPTLHLKSYLTFFLKEDASNILINIFNKYSDIINRLSSVVHVITASNWHRSLSTESRVKAEEIFLITTHYIYLSLCIFGNVFERKQWLFKIKG